MDVQNRDRSTAAIAVALGGVVLGEATGLFLSTVLGISVIAAAAVALVALARH